MKHSLQKFTSWAVQNELLELSAHAVVRQRCACIREACAFASIVDDTTDITMYKNKSIVVRDVDEDLVPHEVFLAFFTQNNGTTGEGLSAMLLDIFLRLGLPLENLYGQTSDGANCYHYRSQKQ